MTVLINDKPTEVNTGTTLAQLLENLNIPSNGTAVAVNGALAKRDAWPSATLNDGDKVLIISAAYGG